MIRSAFATRWRVALLVAGLVLTAMAGALVPVVLDGATIGGEAPTPADLGPAAAVVVRQVEPTISPTTHPAVALPARPVPRPTETPVALAPSPVSTVVTPEPTPAPSPTSPPTAADVWNTVSPALDSTWGQDTAATITILDAFVARFPDYPPAREKLYAALLAGTFDSVDRGADADAANQLGRAIALAPDRPEAGLVAAALNLTPSTLP